MLHKAREHCRQQASSEVSLCVSLSWEPYLHDLSFLSVYGTLWSLMQSKLFQCVLLCTPVRAAERQNFCSISARSSQRVPLLLSLGISHSLRYDNFSTRNSSRPIKNQDSLAQQVKYFIYQDVVYNYKDKFNEIIATNTTEWLS